MSKAARGFTLIELLVVVGIITVVSGIVLSSQSNFNKTLILANTTYDVALTLRSAQTFGLGSRAYGSSVNAGYGLHIETSQPNRMVLFSDVAPAALCDKPDCLPGDYLYSAGSDQLVRTYELGNGITISNFCAQSAGGWACSSGGDLSSLDIVFARPNPDAHVRKNGTSIPGFDPTAACLTVSSPQGAARFISIGASGQIAANAGACPP